MPVEIGANNRARWYVSPQMLAVLAKHHGNPMKVRPLVEWGAGTWTKGRCLWIRPADEALQGHSPHFKATLGYRVRTLRKRRGVGELKFEVGTPTITTSAPAAAGEVDE